MELPQNLIPTTTNPKSPLDFMNIFIPMLSLENYNEYISNDIGRAYYFSTNGSNNGLVEWKKYIEKFNPWNETYENKYLSFQNSLITHKTIGWYAMKNTPEQYNIWHKNWISDMIDSCILNPSNVNIAELVYRKYWLHFVYSNKKLYEFGLDDHRWKRHADCMSTFEKILLEEINNELPIQYFNSEYSSITRNRRSRRDSPIPDEIEDLKIESIFQITKKLNTKSHRKEIIRIIHGKFLIDFFENNLDNNPNLLGVINGVIEISDNSVVSQPPVRFRPGKPEDYITMTTKIPYREDFHIDHSIVKRYLKYLKQVFPDVELMQHMRKDISSYLNGNNSEKLFRIICGDRNTSKSVFLRMIQNTFGDYCYVISPSIIKKGINDYSFSGTHILTCAYLQDGQKIKPNIFEHTNKKIILMTDKVPSLDKSCNIQVVKNQLKLIPFLSKFVDNGYHEDENEQYQRRIFKKDENMNEYMMILSQGMLWCAVEDYKSYREDGLFPTPQLIHDELHKYLQINSI